VISCISTVEKTHSETGVYGSSTKAMEMLALSLYLNQNTLSKRSTSQ
jgi:hypothetical protein